MSVTTQGIIIVLLTWLLAFGVFLLHPVTKKLTNSYMWFWLPWGVFTASLCLIFRYIPDWIEHINNWFYLGKNVNAIDISRIFLLDACPMIGVLNMVACLIPNRKFGQIMAPISILAALITISSFGLSGEFSIKYLITGQDTNNRGFFLIHFLNLITSCLFIVSCPRYTWKDFGKTAIFALSYLCYVGLLIAVFGANHLTSNVTGLLPGDWIATGEYASFANIIGISYPYVAIISALICYGVLTLLSMVFMWYGKLKPCQISNNKYEYWYWQYYEIPTKLIKNKKAKF